MARNPFRDGASAGAASGFNPWIMGGAAALSALNGAFGDDASEELQKRAIALQERGYNDREPLRAMALSRLEAARPTRPDMTADFADPSNPFYRAPQPLSFGEGYASPGASKGETKLKAAGLSSLVKPPGPTHEESWTALPEFAQKQIPGADPRMAGLPENVRSAAEFSPGLRKKIFAKMGL